MNRRQFLKKMGFVGLALAAPLPGPFIGKKDPYPDFDPEQCYGDFVTATAEVPGDVWMGTLDKQVGMVIPPEYREKVKYWAVRNGPSSTDPLLQYPMVYCWKYAPSGEAHRRGLVDGRDHVRWRSEMNHCILNDGPVKVEAIF